MQGNNDASDKKKEIVKMYCNLLLTRTALCLGSSVHSSYVKYNIFTST